MSFFWLALVTCLTGQGSAEVRATVSSPGVARETGEPMAVKVAFRNVSDRPIVLLGIRGRTAAGTVVKEENFLGSPPKAKGKGDRFHFYNLLAPGEDTSLFVEVSGMAGAFQVDFQLDYLTVDKAMLALPVFAMVRKTRIKRNPPRYASEEEYRLYTRRRRIGTLAEAWRARVEQGATDPVLPYVLDVSSSMVGKTRTSQARASVVIKPNPAIQALRRDFPGVREYRSTIPHFGLAFKRGDTMYVRRARGDRKLGRLSFPALAHVGRLVLTGRPIRIGLAGNVPCLETAFASRIQPNDQPPGQAVEFGQGGPAVDIQPAELNRVWQCLQRDDAEMGLSEYGRYLVVTGRMKADLKGI
jgi:hypothetical protein